MELGVNRCYSGISTLCGNGQLDPDEQCDGVLLGGATCRAIGYLDGELACDAWCGFDVRACRLSECGDAIREGQEACDGTDFDGATCEILGYYGGTLTCTTQCTLDTSSCDDRCGNGLIEPGEDCDGGNLGGASCVSQGFLGGSLACTPGCELDTSGCTLSLCGNGIVEVSEGCDDGNLEPGDGCSALCAVEWGWDCVGQPSVCARRCGNGTIDTAEQCDGAALGGQTCESLGQGYIGGALGCATDCTFDTSGCELPTCGNGAIDPGEQCDGVLLGGQTCVSLGNYVGGTLLCSPQCLFDPSSCIPSACGDGIVSAGEVCDDGNQQSGDGCDPLCNVESGWECDGASPSSCNALCGNGSVDPNEECDGTLLHGNTCQSLGYDTGTLGCTGSCSYDTTGCSVFTCGDGAVTGVEDCDGTNLAGATCQLLGFTGGSLQCTANCAFDTAACTGACGDGTWNPGEDCDGSDLHGQSCLTQGFPGGTLACDAGCAFDPSGCLTEVCANGVREGAEECDGTDYGGQTCASFGFVGGALACTAACTIDTAGCVNNVCGNGVLEGGEQCDDGDSSPGDGCDGLCQTETGWVCAGAPSVCTLVCGNGHVDAGEQCDAPDYGGASCHTFGYDTGTLGCAASCTYDLSGCGYVSCGNGVAEPEEACDGTDLRGLSCRSFGLGAGTLLCTSGCVFDTSGCSPAACGDGVVSPGETCDDGGTINGDGCNALCQVEPGWLCQSTPSSCVVACGNGVADAGEACDGADVGGATCQSLGFDAGTLACRLDCALDTTACTVSSCGNHVVEGVEACDGTDLSGQSCAALGYSGGSLACTPSCAFDVSSCTAPVCGDGVLGLLEACDDQNVADGDGCSSACQVESGWICQGEPSSCAPSCGNGTADAGEACDTSDLSGQSCQSIGMAGGTLACTGSCGFDTSGCLVAVCGNGVAEPGEECDGTDFRGYTCADFGYSGWTLTCAGCAIDDTLCSSCSSTLSTVFHEDFTSPPSGVWETGTDVVVNGSLWSAYTLPNHGVRIADGQLQITNRVTGSPQHGQGYAYVKAGGVGSQYDNTVYNSVLADNAGVEIVWSLNLRRDDPDFTDGGFSCSSPSSQNAITVGLAYVLAGSSAEGLNASPSTCGASATAHGYAVVMGGQSGSVRLVRFQDGLRNGTLTNIVSSGGFAPDRYFSVRVTYDTVTSQWRLEVRSDGSSGFVDPATGSYGFTGTGTDNTYVNAPLDYAGPYFQTGCTGWCDETYTARFDNVSVGVRCAP